jgi:hypothetical protein
MRLIHGPTVTPQFPYLEDEGNFNVLRRMDQTQKDDSNPGDSKAFEALLVQGYFVDRSSFFFFFFFLGRKFFEFSCQKDFEAFRQLEETPII